MDFIENYYEFLDNNIKTAISPENLMEIVNFKNRKIYVNGEINDEIAQKVIQKIQFYNTVDDNKYNSKNRQPIKLYINSDGGEIDAGFSIIDTIFLSKTPIYTINYGRAYSCSLYIFAAGNKRYAYPNSTFMLHKGSIIMGEKDAQKFWDYANFYETQLNATRALIMKYTGITSTMFDKHKDNDWYITADEAKLLDIVDKVIINSKELED